MGFGLFSPLSKVSKEPKRAPTVVPQQQQHLSVGQVPARPASAVLDPRMRMGGPQDPQAALSSKRRGSASGLGMQRDKMGGSSGSISSISSASSSKFTGNFFRSSMSNLSFKSVFHCSLHFIDKQRLHMLIDPSRSLIFQCKNCSIC